MPLYRRGPGSLYRRARSLEYLVTRDRRAVARFLLGAGLPLGPAGRLDLLRRFVAVTNQVRGYHTLSEMLALTGEILRRPRPVVVEAGCAHGSSTAKLSLATRAAGGTLLVFDSFRGLPDNHERHHHLDGRQVAFRAGAFRATLPAVRRTVARFGAPEVCEFHKGWYADTLPALDPALRIDLAILDVDLLSSTRLCIRELYPRLRPGGLLVSLDGQLRATHDLLADRGFWRDEVGTWPPPPVAGLGRAKLLAVPA